MPLVVNNLPANAGDVRDAGLIPGLGRDGKEDSLEESLATTPVWLPGESHGQRNHKVAESDTTEVT